MTTWNAIDSAPKDGTEILLWYPARRAPGRSSPGLDDGGAIQGWWFSSPKEIDDGWETVIGFVGEPTHWAELTEPNEKDR